MSPPAQQQRSPPTLSFVPASSSLERSYSISPPRQSRRQVTVSLPPPQLLHRPQVQDQVFGPPRSSLAAYEPSVSLYSSPYQPHQQPHQQPHRQPQPHDPYRPCQASPYPPYHRQYSDQAPPIPLPHCPHHSDQSDRYYSQDPPPVPASHPRSPQPQYIVLPLTPRNLSHLPNPPRQNITTYLATDQNFERTPLGMPSDRGRLGSRVRAETREWDRRWNEMERRASGGSERF